jgi:glycosyltransferase involved in cell wall biosynthesis
MNERAATEKIRIAVVHDHLGWPGGGERTALTIALALGADFVTAYSNERTYPDYQAELGPRLRVLSRKVSAIDRMVLRFAWTRLVFWRNRSILREYDVVLASGQAATEAVANLTRPDAVRFVYTHTPPRAIYDLLDENRRRYPLILRPAFSVFAVFWRGLYRRALRRIDFNIANSENVRRRLRRFTGHEANAVLWPPIDTGKFTWLGEGDYFLSWARVDRNKRVERIVDAFKRMPEQRLVVASGGPNLEVVRESVKGFPNISVVGWQTDEQLRELVGRCRAAVYIPHDEDAGMTHLEANAAGKPALGVDEGGLAETIVPDVTGLALPVDPSVEAIMDGVRRMTAAWCLERRGECEHHAAQFSVGRFAERFREFVGREDPRKPVIGIDASRWSDPRSPGEGVGTGVEAYVRGLVTALIPELEAKARVRLYAPTLLPGVEPVLQKVIPGRRLWTLRHLDRELRERPPAAFFTPGYFIPRSAPKRSFATIHDVLFLREPDKYPLRERLWQGLVTRWNVRRAARIFTVSVSSRDDIVRLCGVRPERICITPVAHERWTGIDRSRTREPIVLYVGRIEKKKSVDVLVTAFSELARSLSDVRLVLVGQPGFGHEEIRALAARSPASDRIEFAGFVSEEAKKGLFTRAACLVHPSVSEGSSIPLLEAWDAEVPAVISDAPVMTGLAQGAASVFHAGDSHDLADKIRAVMSDESLRRSLVEKGRERLEDFSWRQSAKTVAGVLLGDTLQ